MIGQVCDARAEFAMGGSRWVRIDETRPSRKVAA